MHDNNERSRLQRRTENVQTADPNCRLSSAVRKHVRLVLLSKLALVLVRFDHVASFIVNADHSIM
jgi:hypothetical protein